MSRDPIDALGVALDHLALMERHREVGDLAMPVVFDAVCMRLSSAIEALSGVPRDWLDEAFGERWPQIRATRNVIAHVYDQIEEEVIRDVVDRELAELTAGVRRMIDRHAPGLEPELP